MSDEPNLELLRAMSTGLLQLYRGALARDLADAQRRPGQATATEAFCRSRLTAIDQVLGERGIVRA